MIHFLDQQFKKPFIEIEEESKYLSKDSIQTPKNILLMDKAEMITFPPEMTKKSSICSKNCIFNKISSLLFYITLLVLILTIISLFPEK